MRKDSTLKTGSEIIIGDMYAAAVGIFEAENSPFTLVQIVNTSPRSHEFARVYSKDDTIHILYYPGKDNTKDITKKLRVEPLLSIRQYVDDHLDLSEADRKKNIIKHFIVAEVNDIVKWVPANHYVYAIFNTETQYLEIEDSRNWVPYKTTGIEQAILPQGTYSDEDDFVLVPQSTNPKRDWQKQWDVWQCGYYVLMAMHRYVHGDKIAEEQKIDEEKIQFLNTFYEHGLKVFERPDEEQEQTNSGNLISF